MRETGYYWVRFFTDWEPAEFNGTTWERIGMEGEWSEGDVQEVGPEIKR